MLSVLKLRLRNLCIYGSAAVTTPVFPILSFSSFPPNDTHISAGCLKVCIHGVTLCCYLSRGKVEYGRGIKKAPRCH